MVISNNFEKGQIVKFPASLEVKAKDVIMTINHHFDTANNLNERFKTYLQRKIAEQLEVQ